MMYAFIAAHEVDFSVKAMCHVLGVQRSGYYAWKRRPVSSREQANVDLLAKIRKPLKSVATPTAVCAFASYWLRKGYGFSRHRIGRLMKKAHLIPLRANKWHPQTTRQREPNCAQPAEPGVSGFAA
jgi:putative transposase